MGLVLGVIADQVNPFFEFHRAAISEGEVWRIFSANFVHLNFNHALMNMAALALVFIMFYEVSLRFWLAIILLLSVMVGLCLYCFDNNLQRYVGLSGALYGLWIFGALVTWENNKIISAAVIGLMLFAVYQQQSQDFDNAYLQSWIDGDVIVNAHLYGLIGGFIFGAVNLVHTLVLARRAA